jgi:hypothetical protein
MIEQTTLDGQPVTIGYFTRDFEPAEKDKADFCKVFFEDGRVLNAGPTTDIRLKAMTPLGKSRGAARVNCAGINLVAPKESS